MAILKFLLRFIVAVVVASISGTFGWITVAILLRFTHYRKTGPGPDDSELFNSMLGALPFGVIFAVIVLLWNMRTKGGRVFKKL